MSMRFQLGFCLAAFTVLGAVANAQAVLSVDPSVQATTNGSVVTVDVNVSNVNDLYGYQFDLGFNPSVLQAVSLSEGSFLATDGSTFFIPGAKDNLAGAVFATADTLLAPISGANGSGALAVFTFDAIGTGTSTFTIQNETLLNSDLNVISDRATTGFVTVKSPTIAAPEIEPRSATSALTLLLGSLMMLRGRRVRDAT